MEEEVGGVAVRCWASRPTSLVDVVEQALPRSADDVLIVDPALERTVTYGQFAALVEGAGQALEARGLRPGDRVALLVRNGLEAAVALWACARAGLVHVGLPADAPPARLADLAALTGPSLVLCQPGLRALADEAGLAADDAADVLLTRRLPWRTGRPLPDEDATYALIATSGTTGRPKAVRVTGRMVGHAAVTYTRLLGLTPRDRTAIHLSFAWVSGHVTQLAPAMWSGGSAVTMATFSASSLVDVCRRHAVTWLDVVPSIWELLLRQPGFRADELPGVRAAVFGGAPAPPGTLDRVRERMPQLRLLDVYAQSETCAPVTVLGDLEALRKPGTVGTPVPYCDVRVVGADGGELPPGEPGEVEVRSPTVTPGYWPPDVAPVVDGWLRTGDIGRLDDEGFLTISGRAVDLVIRGGVNIFPAEVERALLAAGGLADAAVVGVPSAVGGQNVAALVVPLPGHDVDVLALQRAVRDALGAHAVPRPLRAVEQLPRGRNDKVDRAAVTALLQQGR
ncbi:MAG TPA: class I adenylate-forming enzyme family protein [Mycobacteriales bacterium]|nr:class I adenylate-forming enzyme family protein [Mycobacteriales bacterium]